MQDLTVDNTHVDENTKMFADARLQPEKILDAQRMVWMELRVAGAQQKALGKNFLILGYPFEHNGLYYSRILNGDIRGTTAGYEGPSLDKFNSSDLSWQIKQNVAPGVPLAWLHEGEGNGADNVLAWHKGMGGEAKGGRVLFNLHYKDSWTALFHEPVHEAAPNGGIGTKPRWIYEGYCEIFAEKIAAKLGFGYNMDGVYAEYARETQKIIDFVGDTYFARAYFTNDNWSYGLMAPIFYDPVTRKAIAPAIDQRYLPSPLYRNDVPSEIRDLIQAAVRDSKTEWYQRWVKLYGRSDTMPPMPATAMPGTQATVPQGGPGVIPSTVPQGGPPPIPQGGGGLRRLGQQALVPARLTGTNPPTGWSADR